MNLDYFKYCKEILIDLQKALDENNKYKIYELIPSLIPVVAITYYCLTEDIIITRDDKNPDINTKFTLNMQTSKLEDILQYPELIDITNKMTDSSLWLLSAIRNSIMHGASQIDINEHKLLINNKSFKNQLECEINLNWFLNYLLKINVQTCLVKDEISFITCETIDKLDVDKNIKDFPSKYIYDYFFSFYKITIKSKENNQNPIPQYNILDWIINYIYKYKKDFNLSLESDNEFSLVNCFKKYFPRKENETEDEYHGRMFRHYLGKHLAVNFSEKFPDYTIEVQPVRPKSEFNELLDQETIEIVYERGDLNQQLRFASAKITNELLSDKVMPFKGETFFQEFIKNFIGVSEFIQPEYITNDDLALLLTNDIDKQNIAYKHILQKVKGYNVILKKTYDKMILKKILQNDFAGLDFGISIGLRREISYRFDNLSYKDPEILKFAKERCPYLFDKYSMILAQENSLSDQDNEVLQNLPLNEIENLSQLLSYSKNDLIKMTIYLAGINCYILNKESIFDKGEEIYSEVIDDSFEAYSKTVYDHNYRIINQSLEKIEAKLQKLCSMKYSDKTPQHVIDKHKQEAEQLEREKQKLLEQSSDFIVREIDGINMVKVDKKNCSTLIRNSISHPERFEVLDDLTIKLIDYDASGVISGVVFVPFDNLLNFFLNDAFDKKLSELNNN